MEDKITTICIIIIVAAGIINIINIILTNMVYNF